MNFFFLSLWVVLTPHRTKSLVGRMKLLGVKSVSWRVIQSVRCILFPFEIAGTFRFSPFDVKVYGEILV